MSRPTRRSHPSTLLRQLGAQARRRYGQHFLASEGVLRRIVASAQITPGDRVLEIGPGLGVLTEALLDAGALVTAVEIDPELAAFLHERFADRAGFRLIAMDAARVRDWSAHLNGGGWRCVSNLPYNVGTGLVETMLRHPGTFSRLVVMLQKEVADRMAAPVGARKRGSLSVFVQSRAETRLAIKVPPGAFHPPPKVGSAVLTLDLFPEARTHGVSPDRHEAIARLLFASPRKTIRRGLLARYPRPVTDGALATAGLDPRARPAQLSSQEISALVRALDAPEDPASEGG